MGSRTDLHTILTSLLGSSNVYFQPPASIEMKYPCIVYERDYFKKEFADNISYSIGKRYNLTVIDKNPDSTIPDRVAALPKCAFDRHFVADNLNHDVFSIYF